MRWDFPPYRSICLLNLQHFCIWIVLFHSHHSVQRKWQPYYDQLKVMSDLLLPLLHKISLHSFEQSVCVSHESKTLQDDKVGLLKISMIYFKQGKAIESILWCIMFVCLFYFSRKLLIRLGCNFTWAFLIISCLELPKMGYIACIIMYRLA